MISNRRKFEYDPSINPNVKSTLRGHTDRIYSLLSFPNGHLASGSADGKILLWNTQTRQSKTLSGHTHNVRSLALLSGNRLLSGSDDNSIRVWDFTSETSEVFYNSSNCARSLTASANSDYLVGGFSDGEIRRWNYTTKNLEILAGHTGRIWSVITLSDGRIASGASDDNVRLWNLRTKESQAFTGHVGSVYCLAELLDKRLASGSADETIRLWDFQTGAVQVLSGHTDSVTALSVLPDGIRLASASQDKTIRLWDLGIAQSLAIIEGVDAFALALTVLSDGILAGGYSDNAIRFLDVGLRPTLNERLPPPPVFPLFEDTAQPHLIKRDAVALDIELGRGAFGVVYKAKWSFSDVAVKSYLQPDVAKAVREEVNIMLNLRNDYLIRFYGLVDDAVGPPMLVMELCTGGAMDAYLHSQAPITWAVKLKLALEMSNGLAHLHDHQIIHADLKSLNVLLKDGHAKLCDFGLSRSRLYSYTTAQEPDAPIGGSLPWMAPELFSGNSDIAKLTRASDVWALGMLFFELASRQFPYAAATTRGHLMGLILQAGGETVPRECENSMPGFAQIMRRCWQVRNNRPSAAKLVTELQRLQIAP